MTTTATATTGFARLPASPAPSHYDLALDWVDLHRTTVFEGRVAIALRFADAADAQTLVRLNAVGLAIGAVYLRGATERKATRVSFFPGDQTVEFEFPPKPAEDMSAEAVLHVAFEGKLNTQLAGFYKSTLSPTSFMGMTQFEATDARRAFPCFDEPDRKATFHVTITAAKEFLVLGNTRAKSKTSVVGKWASGEAREGVQWDFYDTPKMSTYLVAWVVAPVDAFDMASQVSPLTQIETQVFVPKGKLGQSEFAVRTGVRALDFFAKLFDIPYPLPLMQHIGVADFAAGAMENFGLITYREARLVVDPQKTTTAAKRDVARVICHEIAHQWFGNQVTMSWWTDLWLNEGFARFCEFLAADELYPEFDLFTTFDLDVVGTALRLDALKSSHAIRVEVGHPDEINEIFDAVSYAKGATVLRMLTRFLGGKDVFVRGVQLYLKKHAYQNCESDDLWRSLEQGAGLEAGSIVNVMRAWTTLIGYPVVSVHVARETGGISLSQQRYLASGWPTGGGESAPAWTIPVSLLTSSSSSTSASVAEEAAEFFAVTPGVASPALSALESKLSALKQDESSWFVLNSTNDLFRVLYTEAQWRSIGREAMAKARVPPRTRLGLVRDAFDLAESGHQSVSIALDLALTLLQESSLERDPTVLLLVVSKLNALVNLFATSGEDVSVKLNALVASKLGNGLLRVLGPWQASEAGLKEYFGEKMDSVKVDELRVAALRCAVDCATIANENSIARESFEFLKEHCRVGGASVPNDLRPAVFRMGATYNGPEALNLLLARFETCESQEKREIFSAFGGLRNANDLVRAIAFTKSDKVRSQDVPIAVGAISSSLAGGRLLSEDFRGNFDWWFKNFSDGNFLWSGIVGSICSGLTTEALAKQIVDFFAARPGKLGSAKRALDQAYERVVAREAQVIRDYPKLQEFLKGFDAV